MNWGSIHISAQAYAEYGLIEKGIGVEDAMVLEYLGYWWNNPKSEKIEIGGEKYVWCDYNTLLDSLVFLNSKSKVTASRKMKKLNTAGLIELYRDAKGRIFYKLTELALKVLGMANLPLSNRKRGRYQFDNSINNNNINNNNINNNIYNNITYKDVEHGKRSLTSERLSNSSGLKNKNFLKEKSEKFNKSHSINKFLNKNLNSRSTTMAKENSKGKFIEEIWELFKKIYRDNRGEEYFGDLTGKERSGIGKLIAYTRKELKKRGAEDDYYNVRFSLSLIFTVAVCVPDKFLRMNVSPMFIYSKFNQYMQYRNIQGFDDPFRGLHPLTLKALREKEQERKKAIQKIENEAQSRADKIKEEIKELEQKMIPADINTPFRRWYVEKHLMNTKYGEMLEDLRFGKLKEYYAQHPEIFQLKAEIIRRHLEEINAKYNKQH